jgi:hypothetical protein
MKFWIISEGAGRLYMRGVMKYLYTRANPHQPHPGLGAHGSKRNIFQNNIFTHIANKMPKRTPKKDPETYQKEEIAIKNAYQSCLRNQNQKITVLAREFDAPYRRLLARIHGQTSYQDRPVANSLLTDAEERTVKVWIEQLDTIGTPLTNRMITGCANAILTRANPHLDPPPTVGLNWVYGFLKRLLDGYERVEQKPIDPKRLDAQDLGVLQTWFDRLKIQLDTKKITYLNIWNFGRVGIIY